MFSYRDLKLQSCSILHNTCYQIDVHRTVQLISAKFWKNACFLSLDISSALSSRLFDLIHYEQFFLVDIYIYIYFLTANKHFSSGQLGELVAITLSISPMISLFSFVKIWRYLGNSSQRSKRMCKSWRGKTLTETNIQTFCLKTTLQLFRYFAFRKVHISHINENSPCNICLKESWTLISIP